jgi:hypothetical protein
MTKPETRFGAEQLCRDLQQFNRKASKTENIVKSQFNTVKSIF